MTWDSRLRLDVVDDEIIITMPGTSYSVTYFKRANSPQLLARDPLLNKLYSKDLSGKSGRTSANKSCLPAQALPRYS